MPGHVQFAHDTSALHAGVCLLSYVAFFVTAILSNSFLVSKTGLYMPWRFTGGILNIIGGALLYTIELSNITSQGFLLQHSASIGCQRIQRDCLLSYPGQGMRGVYTPSYFLMICIIPMLSTPKASLFNKTTDKISLLLPTASRPAVQPSNRHSLGSTVGFSAHLMLQHDHLCLK